MVLTRKNPIKKLKIQSQIYSKEVTGKSDSIKVETRKYRGKEKELL